MPYPLTGYDVLRQQVVDNFVLAGGGGIGVDANAFLKSVIGDIIQLRVFSDTDTFTNVLNIGTTYSATHVSEPKFLE